MSDLYIFDDVLRAPLPYRAEALAKEFRTYDFPPVFHGIATASRLGLGEWLHRYFPELTIKTTFFRRSPLGQAEPNYIHTDESMGDWTGIFYLNPTPAEGDGTVFWRHATTLHESGAEWMYDGHEPGKWVETQRVAAKFNRLLLFNARLFHSRAIPENYGEGDGARLIQVMFGTGRLP